MAQVQNSCLFKKSGAQAYCSAAGLSARVPLKAAMTGVELLVDRAQLWEQSAARHVSIADQLAAVEALARRWRKFELTSWQLLFKQALERHAEGPSSSFSSKTTNQSLPTTVVH